MKVMYSIDRQLINDSESSITVLSFPDDIYKIYVAKCPKYKTGFIEPIIVKGRENFAKKIVELMFGETQQDHIVKDQSVS